MGLFLSKKDFSIQNELNIPRSQFDKELHGWFGPAEWSKNVEKKNSTFGPRSFRFQNEPGNSQNNQLEESENSEYNETENFDEEQDDLDDLRSNALTEDRQDMIDELDKPESVVSSHTYSSDVVSTYAPTQTSSILAQHSITPSIISTYSFKRVNVSWTQRDFVVKLVNYKREYTKLPQLLYQNKIRNDPINPIEFYVIKGTIVSGIYDLRVEKESEIIANYIPIMLFVNKKSGKIFRVDVVDSAFKNRKMTLDELLPLKQKDINDPLSVLKEWFGNKTLKNATMDMKMFLLATKKRTPSIYKPEPTLQPSRLGNLIVEASLKNISGTVFFSQFSKTKIFFNRLELIKSDFSKIILDGYLIMEWNGSKLNLPILLVNLNHTVKRIRLKQPVYLPGTENMKMKNLLEKFNLKHPCPSLIIPYNYDRNSNSSNSVMKSRRKSAPLKSLLKDKKRNSVINSNIVDDDCTCIIAGEGLWIKNMNMIIGTTNGFYKYPSIQLHCLKIMSSKNHKYKQCIRVSEKIILKDVVTLHENMAVTSGYNPGVKMSVKGYLINHALELCLQISSFRKEFHTKINVTMDGRYLKFYPNHYVDSCNGKRNIKLRMFKNSKRKRKKMNNSVKNKENWFYLFDFMNLENDLKKSIPNFISKELCFISISGFSFVYNPKNDRIYDISLVLKLAPTMRYGTVIPGLRTTEKCNIISYILDSHRLRTAPGLEFKIKIYGKTMTLSPNKRGILQVKYDPRFSFNFGGNKDFLFKIPLGCLMFEHGITPVKDSTSLESNIYLTEYSIDFVSRDDIIEVKIFGYILSDDGKDNNNNNNNNGVNDVIDNVNRNFDINDEGRNDLIHDVHDLNVNNNVNRRQIPVELNFNCSPFGKHLRSVPDLHVGEERIYCYFNDEFQQILSKVRLKRRFVDCAIHIWKFKAKETPKENFFN